MAPRGRQDLSETNISFDLKRLFDPYNFDHIPVEKRLGLFKQRDLPHIKHYKAAVKIFGGPHCRTRAIIAPPMETPIKHKLGLYHNVFVPPPAPLMNGNLKPVQEIIKVPTLEEKAQADEDEKIAKYKSWINERKKLRGDLGNLGVNEDFLARKPDKTELEKRVQSNFKAVRLWKPETPPPPELPPSPKPLPEKPKIAAPPPDGLQLLDKFLTLNRMRLMDLFLLADKDKSWSISREELLNAVSSSKIPLTESEVDDIIITLDQDLDDELAYKELNAGLTQWRKQQRELKKQGADVRSSLESIPGSNDRQSKSIEERAQSQEATLLKGFTREHTNKSMKTISKDSNRDSSKQQRTSSTTVSTKKSKSHEEDSLGTRKSAQPQFEVQISDSEEAPKLSREKTKDSSSQLISKNRASFSSNLIDSSTSDAATTRDVASRGRTSEGTASHGLGSRDRRSELPASRMITSNDQTSGQMVTRAVVSQDQSLEVPQSSEITSRDRSSELPSEIVTNETMPLVSQQSKSVYEDMLFSAEEMPKSASFHPGDIGEEIDEDGRDATTGDMSHKISTPPRPSSNKSTSGRQSRQSKSSTPNSLEAPEVDLRPECRVIGSAEAMLDLRKHDKVVLSRNNIRSGLKKEQRITFDELPGVIKIGYKPIDDHCSESTMEGEAGRMVDQFRREKLREYFMVKSLFEESGLPFTQKALDRVLLYPGDKPTNMNRKQLTLPLGPLTDEQSPFNQPKPKKRSKKKRRSMGRASRASLMTGGLSGGDGAGGDLSIPVPRGPNSNGKNVGFLVQDEDRSGSGSSKRSYIHVEDVYPFAATVAPKVYKENLSSGRALITRKVDNWMTFEEYSKYTENLPRRFQGLGRFSDPDAAWPGHLLDKVRLCMDHDLPQRDVHGRPLANRDSNLYEGLGTGLYNGAGNAVFRQTAQQKRAYPGYNNDLLTWPIGENGVRYGTIDEHRVVK